MSTRNNKVGGKTKPAVDKPPKMKKPLPALVLIPCGCGLKIRIWLQPGENNLYQPCECGAVLHLRADYDGRGLANIYEGSIERVQPDERAVL